MKDEYDLHSVLAGVQDIRLLGFDDGAKTDDDDWKTLRALIGVQSEFESMGVLGLRLDGVDHFFQLLEDPADGYRSVFGVSVCRTRPRRCLMQLEHCPPRVNVRVVDDDEITEVVTINGDHVWLRFGTDHSDNYYPVAFYRWRPEG